MAVSPDLTPTQHRKLARSRRLFFDVVWSLNAAKSKHDAMTSVQGPAKLRHDPPLMESTPRCPALRFMMKPRIFRIGIPRVTIAIHRYLGDVLLVCLPKYYGDTLGWSCFSGFLRFRGAAGLCWRGRSHFQHRI